MVEIEGRVAWDFIPKVPMVNGKPLTEEEENQGDQKDENQTQEFKKIALVIDTNVLLKQTRLQELMKMPDMETFDRYFDVVTLEEVIGEVKDQQARDFINHSLPYRLQTKSGETYVEKEDFTLV